MFGTAAAGVRGGPAPRAFFAPWHCEDAALSPDGTRVAFVRADGTPGGEIVIIDVDGAAPTVRIELPASSRARVEASWQLLVGASPLLADLQKERENFSLFWPDSGHLAIQTPSDALYCVTPAGRLTKLADPMSVGVPLRGTAFPRPCRFVDADAGSDSVFVEAQGFAGGWQFSGPDGWGNIPTTLYRMNLDGGDAAPVGSRVVGGLMLYDRQGRPRVLERPPGVPGPAYSLAATELFKSGRATPLGALFARGGATEADAFRRTPGDYVEHRAFPIGFGENPDVLYYASNVGRDTFAICGYDLRRHRPTGVVCADPRFDVADPSGAAPSGLVFDRRLGRLAGVRRWAGPPKTFWLDPQIASVQAEAEAKLPERDVSILGWDDARDRFLLRASSGGDPGRYFVLDRRSNLLTEVGRKMAGLAGGPVAERMAFALAEPRGAEVLGEFLQPAAPPIQPPALVVLCRDSPWDGGPRRFDREGEALAAMGLAVLEVHYRGSSGRGVAFRQALEASPDTAPLEDIRAALRWADRHVRYDSRRSAIVGIGFGGYLACRAVERWPNLFRCAASVDAPLDLRAWTEPAPYEGMAWTDVENIIQPLQLGGGPVDSMLGSVVSRGQGPGASNGIDLMMALHYAQLPYVLAPKSTPPPDFLAMARRRTLGGSPRALRAASAAADAEAIHVPLLLSEPGVPTGDSDAAKRIERGLLRRNIAAACILTDSPYRYAPLGQRARVFDEVRSFLNLTLYSYGVKIGPIRALDDGPAAGASFRR